MICHSNGHLQPVRAFPRRACLAPPEATQAALFVRQLLVTNFSRGGHLFAGHSDWNAATIVAGCIFMVGPTSLSTKQCRPRKHDDE